MSSVRLVVDEDGDVVASYDADEFGNPFTPGGSDPTITDQRWVGGLGYKDEVAATGLYYVRQRYYDPMLGRWLSRDPIGIRGGLNLYQYSFSNPMNFVDPSGLNVYLWAREQQGPTDVGHVWIEVDDPNSPGGRYSIGAYAGPGLQSPDPGCGERTAQGSNEVSPGVIKDASGQRFFLLKTYVTTPDEDQRMIAFLNQHLQESHKNPGSNNPYYNLVIDTKTRTLDINKTKVCTTVATSFLKKTFDPNAPTTIIQPNNLILHYLPTADVKPGPMPGVPK